MSIPTTPTAYGDTLSHLPLEEQVVELKRRLDSVANLAANYAKERSEALKDLSTVSTRLIRVETDSRALREYIETLQKEQEIPLSNGDTLHIKEVPSILGGLGAALDTINKENLILRELYNTLPEMIKTAIVQYFGGALTPTGKKEIAQIIDRAVKNNVVKIE